MPITIANKTITVTTSRLKAIFDGPDLVELRNPQGKLLAGRGDKPLPALALRFTQGETTPLGVSPYHAVTVVKLGERLAHVHVADENGDACLRLMVDERDRLVVEPSATAAACLARGGSQRCRSTAVMAVTACSSTISTGGCG